MTEHLRPTDELYLDVTETVADWPAAAHTAIELVSEGGLVLLAVLLAIVTWRRRRERPALVTAVLAGAATVAVYATSEVLKLLVQQERPCRVLDVEPLAACPPPGDWSLPSNHATIAAALAVALLVVAPRLWPVAILVPLLVAASRVGLGVHYPHDVVDGLLLGAGGVSALVLLLRRPVTRLVLRAEPHV